MSSMQTLDVLERVRAFRARLVDLYHRLAEEEKRERVRMLLGYMERHEERLEHCLSEYEKIAGSSVLRTWFKFVPEMASLNAESFARLETDADIAELTRVGIELDRGVLTLYRTMADNAVSPEVKELFTGLLSNAEREQALLARTSQELEQI